MADHGVRPDAALLAADFRLGRKGEAADFFPCSGRRLGEDECTGAFIEAVEHAVGRTHRAFAQALVHPDFGAGGEVLADPTVVIVAVDVVADEHHAAVVVLHDFVVIDLGDLVVGGDADELRTGAVAGGHVDFVATDDGRGNDGGAAGEGGLPEQFSVFGREAENGFFVALDELGLAVDLRGDDRGIVGGFS